MKQDNKARADKIIRDAWQQFQLARHSQSFMDWYNKSVDLLKKTKSGQ